MTQFDTVFEYEYRQRASASSVNSGSDLFPVTVDPYSRTLYYSNSTLTPVSLSSTLCGVESVQSISESQSGPIYSCGIRPSRGAVVKGLMGHVGKFRVLE